MLKTNSYPNASANANSKDGELGHYCREHWCRARGKREAGVCWRRETVDGRCIAGEIREIWLGWQVRADEELLLLRNLGIKFILRLTNGNVVYQGYPAVAPAMMPLRFPVPAWPTPAYLTARLIDNIIYDATPPQPEPHHPSS